MTETTFITSRGFELGLDLGLVGRDEGWWGRAITLHRSCKAGSTTYPYFYLLTNLLRSNS